MITHRKIHWLRALLAAAVVASGVSAAEAQSAAPATESRIVRLAGDGVPQKLSLSLNKAAVIELDRDARDVVVANPQIADAVVRTPRRVFILSLKIGQTNAIFLDAQGKQIAALDITVGTDVNDLNGVLARELPDSKVKAEALNDSVVLSGTASSVQDASKARDLAVRTAGAPEKVVNALSITGRQQVLIKVRVSEMQRSIAKQLGVDISGAVASAAGVPLVASTANPFSLLGRALSDLSGVKIGNSCTLVSLQQPCVPSPNNVQGVLRALEQVGLVRSLAEPNLTAVSGESAKFLAGGEFPVPTSRDQYGNIVVTFKQFGVGLAFTPVVLDKTRIALQVSTEVSELTSEGAFLQRGVDASGLSIPAIAVRRTETTVELPSGGSLMIGGLLQQTNKQNLDSFPGLKELPVLGALFRSRDFQNSETELVVMVTAYLVDPVAPQQLATPDQGFSLPTDPETVLLGRLNSVYTDRKVPASAPRGSIGYIVQ